MEATYSEVKAAGFVLPKELYQLTPASIRCVSYTHRKGTEMKQKRLSHTDQILHGLKAEGSTITSGEALAFYQCSRLAARICDLKKKGHNIQKRMVQTPSGKFIAQYRLIK